MTGKPFQIRGLGTVGGRAQRLSESTGMPAPLSSRLTPHASRLTGETSMSTSRYDSDRAPKPVGLYPHARRAGDLLFLSGVGPREPGTNAIPGNVHDDDGNLVAYDIAAQCHSVFRNVRAILESAGADWEQLVDVTVFLTSMERDFKTFNAIYAEYFSDHQPCRTTVEVGALPTPIAVELKCIAWLGSAP